MGEFELIRRHFADLTPPASDVALGIGDDAALLRVAADQVLAVTTDTLVAGRHFPLATAPADIGWKALAVNLSDLAAMGAEARWFTLALTLPEPDEAWVASFAEGLRELASAHRVALVGGDTTRGPLSITITAMGRVPPAQTLRRDGAKPGDLVCVTGTLGDAALGLQRLETANDSAPERFLRGRLDRPTPRLDAGLALRGLAHAALDLSDGLAGDLRHILAASGVGAELEPSCLPYSPAFTALTAGMTESQRFALQAQGGDDYELCVCLPPERLAEAQSRLAPLALTAVGRIIAEPGLRLRYPDGAVEALSAGGYSHF